MSKYSAHFILLGNNAKHAISKLIERPSKVSTWLTRTEDGHEMNMPIINS